jgi:hypothetical protein
MEEQDSVSIIQSEREEELKAAEAQAKKLLAEQEMATRKERRQVLKKKILKISGFVMLGLLGAALIAALVWLVINAIMAAGRPVGEVDPGEETPAEELPMVEGHQCTTRNCYKVAELPDERLLIRDTAYYIFDPSSGTALKTTIPERDFHAIVPFTWGDEILAELDPATGRSALYSLTRNSKISEFNYDEFFMDPTDAKYKDMQWIIGKYIIARHDTSIRLLDVFDGSEVVRAQSRVFAYDPFFFGFDGTGERRAYISSGSRLVIAAAGDYLFVKDRRLIHISGASRTTMDIYGSDGQKIQPDNEYYQKLLATLAGKSDYAAALRTMAGVFTVPN